MKRKIKLKIGIATFFLLAIPLNVDATENRHMLIPGGDAVGIHIETAGIIVVDTYEVETDCGTYSPGASAGIKKGDIITEVNGQKITEIEAYKEALIASEGVLTLTINRDGQSSQLVITGCQNAEKEWTTGLYLRNKIAGIGTLTYVDPSTQRYGALGHEIIDADTEEMVGIHKGDLVSSDIVSIKKATRETPGEKVAEIDFTSIHGTISKNNSYGIFGEMTSEHFKKDRMMPIALQDEVNLGAATIYTVLEGNRIEEFAIEIVEVNLQDEQAVKGLKYMVTDERLIEATGGIVQGMSGSPIIQDGQIIGAVTHVLLNDATLGYGVFIEWMLEESEINLNVGQALEVA